MTRLPGILFKAEGVGAEKVDLSTQDESCSNSASNNEMKNMLLHFKTKCHDEKLAKRKTEP